MLRWFKCGDFFGAEDITSISNDFTNKVSDSYIILNNGKPRSIVDENGILYFRSGTIANGVGSLNYTIDPHFGSDNEYPVRIKFKMRLASWTHRTSSIQFLGDLYIHYVDVDGRYIPCFGDVTGDNIFPFTKEMLNSEWTDFELLWVNGHSNILLNGSYVLCIDSNTPLDTSERGIVNYDENFEIYIDIADLEFWRMHEIQHTINTKVVETRDNDTVTLSIETDAEDDIKTESFDYVRIEFANITKNQIVQMSNLTIDRCTLYYEKEINRGIYGVKTFIDNDTMYSFKVHIYSTPNNRHYNSILSTYKYENNTLAGDTLNIAFGVKQNGIDLTGRCLKILQNLSSTDCLPITCNVYFNETLYSTIDRSFDNINFFIPNKFIVNNKAFVPDIRVYDKSNIRIVFSAFTDATVYTRNFEISNCDFVRNERADNTNINCYKVFLNPAGVEFKVHIYVDTLNPENIFHSIEDEYTQDTTTSEGSYYDKVIIEFDAINLAGETVKVSSSVTSSLSAEWFVDNVQVGSQTASRPGSINVKLDVPVK